ncbi:uncharacterized protein [Procambarus clarkii]|uniref:uncharacterized protein n=1 Tax=Procambarus clarkii TaxID=6728 RepID=UPI001E671386|nr:uncharacterized protein LOC123757863 [Procambarus clarkii]
MSVKINISSSTSCSPSSNSPTSSASVSRWWGLLGPRCGGCFTPTTTLRFLAGLALVFGVVISSMEGTLLVREEQKYQRCVLRQAGLVRSRHGDTLNTNIDTDILSVCYPHDINLVRGCGWSGMVVTVVYLLASLLLLVAISTERWQLCLPWACASVAAGIHEVLLVGLCWLLLGAGDLLFYTLHILLLAYSVAVLTSVLRQLSSELP